MPGGTNIIIPSSIVVNTTAISGGTNNYVLFQSAGKVSQSANLTFSGTMLRVKYSTANTTTTPVLILDNQSGGNQTVLGFAINGSVMGYIRNDSSNNMVINASSTGSFYVRNNEEVANLLVINGASLEATFFGNVEAVSYSVNANPGFSGTGAYTSFTFEGGICTSAS